MPSSRMTKVFVLIFGLLVPLAVSALPAAAEDLGSLSCGDLWHERNAIFARNAYCFKSERAMRVFGNENCTFYVEADVPMSQSERHKVDLIREIERQKSCQF
jgi:hypothetical protein